jgi:hypothetical protein
MPGSLIQSKFVALDSSHLGNVVATSRLWLRTQTSHSSTSERMKP